MHVAASSRDAFLLLSRSRSATASARTVTRLPYCAACLVAGSSTHALANCDYVSTVSSHDCR